MHNPKAAKRDEEIAQRKIAEYKSHLKDSTYSIYADTTQRMDKLLAFDNQFTNSYFDRISEQPSLGRSNMRLLPLFRFTLMQPDTSRIEASNRYTLQRVKDFEKKLDNPYLVLSNRPTNIGADSLAMLDSRYAKILRQNPRDWLLQVQYAISQSLIRQFTNSVGAYSSAIADNAANPFLYFNRAVTRAEMIDFISGLDNPYQRISIDSDPANKLTNTHARTYNYDEAIADLDKTLRLFPNFAEAYYNRGTLLALSGKLPEAFEDISKAIELNPEDLTYRAELAVVNLRVGRYEEALNVLKAALEKDPKYAEAYRLMGIAQLQMKKDKEACASFAKAKELGDPNVDALIEKHCK